MAVTIVTHLLDVFAETSSFALARYAATGQLDTRFGSNGPVLTSLSQAAISFVNALVLQSDGKIIAEYANLMTSDSKVIIETIKEVQATKGEIFVVDLREG